MYLDKKLNFPNISKRIRANKAIRVIRKTRHLLPRVSLNKLYKLFVRPHFDYCDIT